MEEGYGGAQRVQIMNNVKILTDCRDKYLCVCRMLHEEQLHSQRLEKIIGNQRKELRRLNASHASSEQIERWKRIEEEIKCMIMREWYLPKNLMREFES